MSKCSGFVFEERREKSLRCKNKFRSLRKEMEKNLKGKNKFKRRLLLAHHKGQGEGNRGPP